MKHGMTLGRALAAVWIAGLLSGCSAPSPHRPLAGMGESSRTKMQVEGVPGGIWVDTFKATVTVKNIDPDSRRLTVAGPDGRTTRLTAGPEVVNFDQIRVGDVIRVTLVSELVVRMKQAGEFALTGEAAAATGAPAGAKPAADIAGSAQTVARVTAIDRNARKATLRFPDDTTRTVPVREDVDISSVKVGDEVVIRLTESLAVRVEKP